MADIWIEELHKTLENIKNQHQGQLTQNDLEGVMKEFIATIDSFINSKQRDEIFQKVSVLSENVSALKECINNIGQNILKDEFIPEVSVELHSVVEQTEKSVIGILDIADALNNLKVADDQLHKTLANYSTNLLELCNFQDITGQMITRIIKRLTAIEASIDQIIEFLKLEGKVTPFNTNHHYDPLLHGPQKEADRPSQAQIDDLFDSIK